MRWRATPPCNCSCAGALASPVFFAASPFLGCMRAGPSHCCRASKSAPGPKGFALARGLASGSACACGCTCTCNASQYRTAACPRGNANWNALMASDRRVCFRRGGRELPAWAGLGINLGGGGSARACAYACICGYADARPRVQSPGIKPAACAFVGAEAVRWPRPRSAQKEARGACENPAAA